MYKYFRDKFLEVFRAVFPLIATVTVLQLTLIQAPDAMFVQFIAGAMLATLGMVLLFTGVDLGILPMGRFIGSELPRRGSLTLILAVVFAIGFAITIAEPDVLVLSGQIETISGSAVSGVSVLYAIALGLAAFAAAGVARIILGWPIKYFLSAAYALALLLCAVTPGDLVSVAFDGGSATTGVLSAPVIIALSVGLSSVLAGRSAVSDGFGILGFASIGPVIAILGLGLLLS